MSLELLDRTGVMLQSITARLDRSGSQMWKSLTGIQVGQPADSDLWTMTLRHNLCDRNRC